jgi:eukaryotic-like serine/threonine-protein kinase
MRTGEDATGSGDDVQATVVEQPVNLVSSAPELDSILDGSMLGRYVVIERLGSGAMGIVLRAYDPKLHREVALKLVRPGTSAYGDFADARLLREAQALARLNHPNIVAVYDVDTTDHGVVIAMEYVEGRTLRSWLKERRRSWSEVVPVMLAAARGLAAAHAADLVHRDVKPDNILVGEGASAQSHDTGRVRVTDFGLARTRSVFHPSDDRDLGAPDGPSEDDSLTQAGTVMGTPGYMSPEQHAGAPADARADQYALCVVMWEALYRERPFSGRGLETLAEAKQAGPGSAPHGSVPGWLHAIVTRGLAVEPEDRWPSMDVLADALASGSARARRRGVALGLSGLALAALAWFGARQIERARGIEACREAGAIVREATWNQEARAALRSALVGTGLSFAATTHERVVAWIDPWVASWERLRTEACIEADVEGRWDPDIRARVEQCFDERLGHLAALVAVLSEGDRASVPRAVAAVSELPRLEPCTDTIALARRPRLPDEPEARQRADEIQHALARARSLGTAGRPEEGLELARRVIEDAAAEGLITRELEAELAAGHYADAAGHYEEAATRLRRAFVEGGALGLDEIAADAVLALMHVSSFSLARRGEGAAYAETAKALVRRLDGDRDTPRHVRLLNNLANIHADHGDADEAERLHERALSMAEAIYGPEHPSLAISLNNLVAIHGGRGDHERAEQLAKRALAVSEGALGPEHPDVAWSLTNVALTYDARGMYDEAESLFRRALALREAALGPRHPLVAVSLTNLGVIADMRYEHETALALFERALSIREAHGPDHLQVAYSLGNIGRVLVRRGEPEAAKTALERALTIHEAAFGPDHPEVARALSDLARAATGRKAHDEARILLERALSIYEAERGPDHPAVAHTLDLLARAHFAQDDHETALALHTRGVAINEASVDGVDLAYSLESLASFHEEREELDDAERIFHRALHIRESLAGVHRHPIFTLVALGRIELARARPELALEPLERALATDERLLRYFAPELVAEARLLLARALWHVDGERERALALARAARREFTEAGGHGEKGLADVDRWLAARR